MKSHSNHKSIKTQPNKMLFVNISHLGIYLLIFCLFASITLSPLHLGEAAELSTEKNGLRTSQSFQVEGPEQPKATPIALPPEESNESSSIEKDELISNHLLRPVIPGSGELPEDALGYIPVITDSRFRYEPLLGEFSVQQFLEERGSLLATQSVRDPNTGEVRKLGDIIQNIALEYEIAPQVLLTLIELHTGLVSASYIDTFQLENPLGLPGETVRGFAHQVEWVASFLDKAAPRYFAEELVQAYDELFLIDGTVLQLPADKSPTQALIRLTGQTAGFEKISQAYGSDTGQFNQLYFKLFGIDALSVPIQITAALSNTKLPFAGTKRYTGGPHGGGTTSVCAQIAVSSGSGIDFSRNTTSDSEYWEVLSIFAGTLLSRDSNVSGGIGNRVRIKYSDSLVAEYWHLNNFSSEIQGKNIGDSIPQGFPIGTTGKSGNQSAVHLHLELRTPSGTPVQWHTETIDSYQIGFHKVYSSQSKGYNYQGSAVKGSTKNKQITAYCGGTNANFALVGANYNNSNEQNGVDANTVFADTRYDSNAGRVNSTNVRNTGSTPPPACNPNADQVAYFLDANYSGSCVIKNAGNFINPSAIGLNNDSISSIKVGANVLAVLCQHDNYQGTCETFTGDDSNLSDNGVGNDSVSSTWVDSRSSSWKALLYADPSFAGSGCGLQGAGSGNMCSGFNDVASSIRILPGWSARVWKDSDLKGSSRCFTSSDENFSNNAFEDGSSLDNQISSITSYNQISCPVTSTPPAAPGLSSPTNGSVISRTSTITLTWNAASGATEYYAEFWGGPNTNINSGWTSNTSWYLGTQWGGSYQWRVKARNSAGESGWSNTWNLTVKYGPPSNLTSTPVSKSQINLSWSASLDAPGNLDGYRIYRNGTSIATVSSSTTSYSNTNLTCGTNYSFVVKSYKGSVESDLSNTSSATTYNCSGSWTTIINETFEGSFPGNWQVADNNGSTGGIYMWGKRTCRAYQGSYSGWAVGGGTNGTPLACGSSYPSSANSWMWYGPFSLADATDGKLTFKAWINSEANYDYIFWGASTNGTNFYGSSYWGNTNGWVEFTLDLKNIYTLGNLMGKTQVWIAISFYSDSSVTYPEGAFVDNILIQKLVGSAVSTIVEQNEESIPVLEGMPTGPIRRK